MTSSSFQLSPNQQQVVDQRGGHLQVIACAGSGKTESISRRVAALVAEGAEPASIVAFTFTERAAAELKERIVRRVEERMGSDFLDRLGPMFVGTIHSYCFRILQDHVPRYGNYDVLDDHRHAGLLSREYRHQPPVEERQPDAITIPLASNRRSRATLIETANAFAQTIPGRLDKAMAPVRKPGPNELVAWSATTEEQEASRIKSRLQVLRPEHPDNYYDQFEIVPSKYRELLGSGKVLVTNWHGFAPKSEHSEGGTSYKVVQKGEETPEAFARARLGDLAHRLPLLVLNDEGHHCWRPAPGKAADKLERAAAKGLLKEQKDAIKAETEEARVWLAGLDRINNAGLAGKDEPCVLACVDLSATPFYLGASGYPEGSPFPWLVSDFGLVDAIESGIVKVPRLPIADDTTTKDDAGRPDPKYYRLWAHVTGSLKPTDKVGKRPKPEAIYRKAEGALVTLASQWKKQFDANQTRSLGDVPVPPVLIVVCDNTDIARVFFEKISGEHVEEVAVKGKKKPIQRTGYKGSAIQFPELENGEGARHTVRIDTKLLAKIEAAEGQSKDQAAQALREIIDTVGKRGGPMAVLKLPPRPCTRATISSRRSSRSSAATSTRR